MSESYICNGAYKCMVKGCYHHAEHAMVTSIYGPLAPCSFPCEDIKGERHECVLTASLSLNELKIIADKGDSIKSAIAAAMLKAVEDA